MSTTLTNKTNNSEYLREPLVHSDEIVRGLNLQKKFLGFALSALLCNTVLFGMKSAYASENDNVIQLASAAKYSSTTNGVVPRQFSVEVLYELALKNIDGDGMSKNEKRGIKLLENAAERGFAKAQYTLGVLHADEGEEETALFWLEKAVDQGHADAQFVFNTILNSDYSIGC